MTKLKLIILDRDGVINYDSEHYIKTPAEFLLIPGSLEAMVKLKKSGYTIAVATNQSGVGRGLYSEETLEKIHQKLQDSLASFQTQIDLICYCPHLPSDHCHCRKPAIGMFEQIQRHFNCILDNVCFVGDSLCDINAAKKAGCLPVLVQTGNGKITLEKLNKEDRISVYENLVEFVNSIC